MASTLTLDNKNHLTIVREDRITGNPHLLLASENRKRVAELRSADKFITMSEIARKVGISRRRVYQILQTEGLPTKHQTIRYQYECPVCGTISSSKFCSNECKKEWQQIPILCSHCGKLFIRDKKQLLHNYPHHDQGLFCSTVCAGKWLAEHHGFKRHPDHIWEQ